MLTMSHVPNDEIVNISDSKVLGVDFVKSTFVYLYAYLVYSDRYTSILFWWLL